MLGDDLGSQTYANLNARLEFTNFPYLKQYGIRPFVFGEWVLYPPHSDAFSQQDFVSWVKRNSRYGFGFGLAIPIPVGFNMSLQIYHNAMVFGANPKGDLVKTGTIHFDFGFF